MFIKDVGGARRGGLAVAATTLLFSALAPVDAAQAQLASNLLAASGTVLPPLPAATANATQVASAEAEPAGSAAAEVVEGGVAGARPPQDTGSTQLEEIQVTARKRKENLQDVPIPITVLGGNTLEKEGFYRIDEIQQKLPSVNFGYQNPRQSSLAIRGLGNNPANDGLESSGGIFLDGVYLGRPGMFNADFIDLDHIELLRGPQGTLFGKNTTAGLLNVTTLAPTFEREVNAEASYGEYNYYQLRASESDALIADKLAQRFSVYKTQQSGYVDGLATGLKYNGPNREGVRGQLLFTPNEKLSVRFIADYNHQKDFETAGPLYNAGPVNYSKYPVYGTNYFTKVAAAFAKVAPPGTPLPPNDFKSYVTDIGSPQGMEVSQGGASVQADWKLGDGYQLTSISAYRWWFFLPTNDADGLSINAITDAGAGVQDHQVTQEIRLSSPTDRTIEYQVGSYFFFQRQGNNLTFLRYGPDADVWLGTPAGTLSNVTSNTFYDPQTNSVAAFSQATWHATKKLALTLGLRDTFERKASDIDRTAPTGPEVTGTPATVRSNLTHPYYTSLTVRNNLLSDLASVTYKVTPGITTYASFSHGAKSGGINPAVPAAGLGASSLIVQPETANDEEVGVKTSLLNKHLNLSLDAYHTLVKDYQASILLPVTGSSSTVSTLSNVGWVRGQGVESEFNYLPLRDLSIAGYVAYNDTQYKSYYNGPCPAENPAKAGQVGCNLTGSQLVGAPRWTSGLTLTPSHTFADGYRGYLVAQYSWRSSFFGAADDSKFSRIGAYGIANFRAGLNINGTWDVSVWADDAFDRRVATTVTPGTYGSYGATPSFPRVIGGTIRVNL